MAAEFRDITPYCRIRIDKEGRWYYEENEIINPLVLRSFCQSLERDGQGRYRIIMNSELCYVEVEDTPFVVSAIRGDPQCGLYLRMNTMETFPLDPGKLSFGDYLSTAFTGYTAKLLIAVALTPLIYLGHAMVHRFLGKQQSDKLAEETANLESL